MTEKKYRKKLIEVALPLAAINEASAREKSIRHGHPSTLHLWWARRPLAACRAILFGQYVDDPSSWPERFPTEQAQEEERNRLFELIEQLVKWENSTNEHVLNSARFEIARSLAWNRGDKPPAKSSPKAILAYLEEHAPPVYDPFSGGGSIPMEAQRLGLRAQGSDLNPVAVLIGKALVEIPPKFADQPPVNPDRDPHRRWRGAQGLAEDIRYYGRWMRDEAEKRIGSLYPPAKVTQQAVREQPSLEPLQGQELTVITWLWARTVASPNPAAKGAHVPLVSSFMLCTKESKKAWVEPTLDSKAPDGYRFVVRSGRLAKDDEAKAKQGTKAGRGANFRCLLTDTPILPDYVKSEGKADRYGWRIMAIVADGPRGRIYLPATTEDEERALSVKVDWKPEIPLSTHPQYMSVTNYGPKIVGDLFMDRQAHALNTFSDLVENARDKVFSDAMEVGFSGKNSTRLVEGGDGASAYADAVATYLGMNVSRLANRQSTSTFWHTSGEKVEQVFAMQALPMRWDTAEGNPFSNSSGNFIGQLDYLTKVVENSCAPVVPATVSQRDAQSADFEGKAVSMDPPYYDNVPYADLSDFFYAWLRRSLRPILPSLFSTIAVPKFEELVADHKRHGSSDAAEGFFLEGMTQVMTRACEESDSSIPAAIYYAFRQGEKSADGISSTGWETFLSAVVQAGFSVDGTWPVKTELTGNLKKKWNALASSIVLVCRKRPESAPVTTRADFWKALKQELPDALRLLQHGNIAPVDMAQASIGPGMAIFSRYSKVLESDDSPMTVKTALQLINAALDEFLSEQEGEYDPHTRFAITWFESHGMGSAEFGAAETLAKARNVSVAGVAEAGLVEARTGSVRLFSRTEMPDDWDPANDSRPTVWEATQHLIRRLEEHGEQAAADLLRRLDSRADPARDLAYRLYQVCQRNNWADEGRAYNGLVIAWPELMKLAQRAPEDLLI